MAKNEPLMLGSVPITAGSETPSRAAILIWGDSGVGKTTLAATGRGKKLWLSCGDNEHVPVQKRKDVLVAKLYDLSLDEFFRQGDSENPFGLDQVLAKQTDIETVVFDSVTACAYLGLHKAIADKVGASKKDNFVPTTMVPGISAYGGRNGLTIRVLQGLLRVTAKHNVDFICTAHEDDPSFVGGGKEIIDHIGVMLGGKIVNSVTWRLSEIWYMSKDKDRRRIAFRPTRLRKPMKTRMFIDNKAPEFYIDYDANQPDNAKGQMTIAGWVEEWLEGNGEKIPIPVSKVKV